MVLADSHGIPRAPCYSGYSKKKGEGFDYWTFTIFGAGFSCFVSSFSLSCYAVLRTPRPEQSFDLGNINSWFPLPHWTSQWFRLFPFRSPLLRESLLLSFPLATEMFQFTRLPLPFLWIQKGVLWGCPIRESSDLCLFPTPRSVSPASAPFIVSECLGLHRKPFFLWPKK